MREAMVGAASLFLLVGCNQVECGPGTHLEGDLCLPDASGGGGGDDSPTDSEGGGDSPITSGDCAPPDLWSGPIPEELYGGGPYEGSYDAGIGTALERGISGYGSGSFGESLIISGATVVAVGKDPRWETAKWYYISDGTATIPVSTDDVAAVGDKVTFAFTKYEGWQGVPMIMEPGAWSVNSSGNPASTRHLGAETAVYGDRHAELVHAAGEIKELAGWDCGEGYTDSTFCFVFEHDGVRDQIRVPVANEWGLNAAHNGGTCAEVIAPVGLLRTSNGVQGYFIDVSQSTWMRTWAKP